MYSPNLNIEGVLDLKRIYQRNMMIGFGIAAVFSIIVTAGIAFIVAQNANAIPVIIPGDGEEVIIDFIQPPKPPRPGGIDVDTPTRPIKPNIENIIAVPDEEAPEVTEILSQNELVDLVPDNPIIDVSQIGTDYGSEVINAILPDPGEFIAVDFMAEKINEIQPVYPQIAARSGVECSLWLQALVDRDGKVVDVRVIKSSNEGIGFEESAIEAAYKTAWKPAIANGHPVAVWVSYKVDFVMN